MPSDYPHCITRDGTVCSSHCIPSGYTVVRGGALVCGRLDASCAPNARPGKRERDDAGRRRTRAQPWCPTCAGGHHRVDCRPRNKPVSLHLFVRWLCLVNYDW